MSSWAYLAIAIVAEVIGTSCLKSAQGFSKLGPSLVVVISYGAAFYCLSMALRSVPVGVAYAIWAGAGIVLIALIGWLWSGQRLDVPAMVGIGLILAGVLVINLFSRSVAH